MSAKVVQGGDGAWRTSPGYERLWAWFGLSRASWIVIPRSVAHEMPDDWQMKFAALLEEYDEAIRDQPEDLEDVTPYVVCRLGKRFAKWPHWLLNYRHPNPDHFRWMRPATPIKGENQ